MDSSKWILAISLLLGVIAVIQASSNVETSKVSSRRGFFRHRPLRFLMKLKLLALKMKLLSKYLKDKAVQKIFLHHSPTSYAKLPPRKPVSKRPVVNQENKWRPKPKPNKQAPKIKSPNFEQLKWNQGVKKPVWSLPGENNKPPKFGPPKLEQTNSFNHGESMKTPVWPGGPPKFMNHKKPPAQNAPKMEQKNNPNPSSDLQNYYWNGIKNTADENSKRPSLPEYEPLPEDNPSVADSPASDNTQTQIIQENAVGHTENKAGNAAESTAPPGCVEVCSWSDLKGGPMCYPAC